jgi:hypothetical protein
MKTTTTKFTFLTIKLVLYIVLQTACAKNKEPKTATQMINLQTNQEVVQKNNFAGNFSGNLNNVPITASLKANGNALTGRITIDGKGGKITATSKGNICKGSLLDDETAIAFSFTGQINANVLNLNLDLTAT